MANNYCVYMHTAPNGKVYIGVTSKKPEKRFNGGLGYQKQPLFYNAIRKYGWENFEHVILAEGLSAEEASQKEIGLILCYNSNDRKYGYNRSIGGEYGATGVKYTEEQRVARSKRLAGRTLSEETKAKIGNANRKYVMSEQHKAAISAFHKGKPWSEEEREKITAAGKKYWRKVVCLDSEGNFIREFESITIAAKAVGVDQSAISNVLSGRNKTSKGFIWRYADEVLSVQ